MAISQESYGRGQTVYGNGSHAPTSGTVDPTGYINRSLNNPSQSRSGLAQAALSRLGGDQMQPAQSPGVLPVGDIKTLTITPTGQLIPDDPGASEQLMQQSQQMQPQPPMGGQPNNPMAQAALSRLMAMGGPQ